MCNDNEILKELETIVESDGVKSLSDDELIALIIRKGTSLKDLTEVSFGLLKRSGGVSGLCEESVAGLMGKNKGLSKTKAVQILCAVELGKRSIPKKDKKNIISCAEDMVELIEEEMSVLKKEHFRVASLNTKGALLNIDNISVGTINASLAYPREVFQNAIINNASGVILIHNHPSGDSSPSIEDTMTTAKLKEAGAILGINVLDHIIIGNGEYYSYKENNKI